MGEQSAAIKKRPLEADAAILPRSKEIGDALWIVLWAYDRATRQRLCRDGTLVGLVLGGSVVRDERIAFELGRSVKWVRRWRPRAVKTGLLRARRFPYGNLLAVMLPRKKFFRHEVKPAPEWAEVGQALGVVGRCEPKSRVPENGESETQEGAIQSAQIAISEGTKSDTRRKTFTWTHAGGLAQKYFAPLPHSPHRGETSPEHSESANARATLLTFVSDEPAKPTKALYELRVRRNTLDAFGQIVAHYAEKGEADLGEIERASIERARHLRLEIPPDPESAVRRILGRAGDDSE